MNGEGPLERRYRRLLAWYPAEHRRVHAEEMVGVLLASARNGQRRPSLADTLDLIKGGIQTRLRPARYDGLDDGWRDTLAIASIATPAMIAMLYAVIFAWTAYHRVSDPAAGLPVAMTAVLVGWRCLSCCLRSLRSGGSGALPCCSTSFPCSSSPTPAPGRSSRASRAGSSSPS